MLVTKNSVPKQVRPISAILNLKTRLGPIGAALLGVMLFGAASPERGAAQSRPTASRKAVLEVFGMGTDVITHYRGGRNGSLTLGGDLLFHGFGRVYPGFELRTTLPVSSGVTAGERSYLGGARIVAEFGRFRPYVNALFGPGQINFVHPAGNYRHDNSTVYDGGGGLQYNLGNGFSVQSEVQYQHWNIGTGGGETFEPIHFSGGVSYRFYSGRTPNR